MTLGHVAEGAEHLPHRVPFALTAWLHVRRRIAVHLQDNKLPARVSWLQVCLSVLGFLASKPVGEDLQYTAALDPDDEETFDGRRDVGLHTSLAPMGLVDCVLEPT